jgi:hypothetical protein
MSQSKFEAWFSVKYKQTYEGLLAEFESENKRVNAIPFAEWWDAYDKKVGTEKARKKWDSLTIAEQKRAMEHTPRYVAVTPDKNYRKDPTTYLNQKTYNDEESITSRIRGKRQTEAAIGNLAQWAELLQK